MPPDLHHSRRNSTKDSTMGPLQKFQKKNLFPFLFISEFLISVLKSKIGWEMNSKFKEMSQIFLTTWGAEIKTLTTWCTKNEFFLHR